MWISGPAADNHTTGRKPELLDEDRTDQSGDDTKAFQRLFALGVFRVFPLQLKAGVVQLD